MLSVKDIKGAVNSSTETLERECEAYSEHIEMIVGQEKKLSRYLSFQNKSSANLLNALRDGVVLAYLINQLKQGAVDLSKIKYDINLNKLGQKHSKTTFEVGENLNLCIEGAKKLKDLGVVVVNLGSNDIMEQNVDLVLGLVWQLVRANLLQHVNLVSHPELVRLLEPGENLKDLINLNSEKLLQKWFNFHLQRAGMSAISNFSQDVSDGFKYICLFEQIAPSTTDKKLLDDAKMEQDKEKRISLVLQFAQLLGCKKYVSYRDVISGHSRLNMAFVAGIFNRYIGIHLPSEQEIRDMYSKMEQFEDKNHQLKSLVESQETKVQELLAKIDDMKQESTQEKQAIIDQMNTRIKDLNREYDKDMEMKRNQVEKLMHGLQLEIESAATKRESEFKGVMEALKAKHKQNIYKMERDGANEKQKLFKAFLEVKSGIEDFLIQNEIELKQDQEDAGDISNIPQQLITYLTAIFEEYYQKIETIDKLERKLEHLNHVNDVYGEKIQEYAEGKVQQEQKKKKKINVKSMFGL